MKSYKNFLLTLIFDLYRKLKLLLILSLIRNKIYFFYNSFIVKNEILL